MNESSFPHGFSSYPRGICVDNGPEVPPHVVAYRREEEWRLAIDQWSPGSVGAGVRSIQVMDGTGLPALQEVPRDASISHDKRIAKAVDFGQTQSIILLG